MKVLFSKQPHNVDHALQILLKALKVKVTGTSSKACLQNHPDYPSLMAMSGCLSDFGVENHTYNIKKEIYQEDLLFPFIAHFPENGGRFILVTKIEGQQIYYSDEFVESAFLSEEEFLKRWDGIALHAESTAESGEANYTQNRFKEMLYSLMAPTAILSLIVVFYLAFANQPLNWSVITLSLLKLCGVGVSVLLLMQSLNANNPFIKNLCTLNGKNDCNAILKSDAAKVTSWLSWSEVGFFYFTGSFLSLLFAPSSFLLLAWLNIFALPYTIYSITYQYRNKNWCVLCCTVQAVLVLEGISFLAADASFKLSAFNYDPTTIAVLTVSFLIPLLIWSFLKPFFTDASQIKSLKYQLKKFKYNSDLFERALKSQPKFAVGEELMPIILGNPAAETIITMVSNPFCGPCAKAHQTIDGWLKQRDDFQLKIIFMTGNDENDPRVQVSRHLNAVNRYKNKTETEKAMSEWYASSKKNYEEWATKYPVIMDKELEMITENQNYWCDVAEIAFTPTILVNGYKLPELYRLEDIKYLLS